MHHTRIPLFLLAVAAVPALAQQNETAEPKQLETVVVTGSPLDMQPAGAAAVNSAGIASMSAATSDTAQLLQNIPGVSLYGAGGVSSLPAIHGLADDRLNTQVDGMNLMPACPNHMNPALSYIDPTNVGSVKVYSGIVPVSVGGDAIGGTIQVDAAAPQFAQSGQGILLKGEVGGFYRSNGNVNGGNLGATVAGENVSITYAGATAKAGDYTAAQDFHPAGPSLGQSWLNGNEVGSSSYNTQNQELGFAFRHDNHLFQLKASFQDISYEGFPNQRMDLTGNTNTNIDLRYTGQFQWGTLEARAYDQTTHHQMQFGYDKELWGYGVDGMPMYADGHTTGGTLKGNIVLSERDILRVGAEVQNYTLNDWWPPVANAAPMMGPNTFQNINNGQRDRFDLFGEWEARWTPQWMSLVGARFDRVRMDTGDVQGYSNTMMYAPDAAAFNSQNHAFTDNNWDLSALARYTRDSSTLYEGGYAIQTRSPNLYQRYAWTTMPMTVAMNNFVGDGNGYVGNLNLKPETAHTLSFTADWHDAAKEQWGLKVTPYYSYVTNYIDAERCNTAGCQSWNQMAMYQSNGTSNLTTTNQFVALQYVNQTAELYGLDVSGQLPLARTGNLGSFTANGVVSYTRGKNLTTGDNLYNIMPLNAKLAVVQKLDGWTNTAELQMVAAKDDISAVRNEVQTPGYSLFNLRSSYQWTKVRVDVGVENLFNRFYYLPLGGAYVGQGATMGMNYETANGTSAWGTAVPGMGRTIYTAFNVKF